MTSPRGVKSLINCITIGEENRDKCSSEMSKFFKNKVHVLNVSYK